MDKSGQGQGEEGVPRGTGAVATTKQTGYTLGDRANDMGIWGAKFLTVEARSYKCGKGENWNTVVLDRNWMHWE